MVELDEQSFAGHRIAGVLTDIDDTLTTEGAITPDALEAIEQLHAAGVHVIPITGRPVGWSEPFARTWRVDAVVAENGAVAVLPDGRKLYQQPAPERESNFARMQQVAARIVREVPGAQLSRDSGGRETDIAIDHGEFTHLPQDAIDRVVEIMRSERMQATVSSIHINGWYGTHDKLEGARWIVRQLFRRDLDKEIDQWVYVGDSTNDVLMFERFPLSVGVANIRRFEKQLAHAPRWVTPGERGAGFAQVVRAVLAGR